MARLVRKNRKLSQRIGPLSVHAHLVMQRFDVRLFLLAALAATPAAAQAPGQQLQVGLATLPGFGAQAVYVDARALYSLETALQGVFDLFGERSSLHVAGSVGAALHPMRIWAAIGSADVVYDVDLGVRYGPRLVFLEDATYQDKNQRFSLFIDPFVRYRCRIGRSRRVAFVEAGPTRPALRAGLWVTL